CSAFGKALLATVAGGENISSAVRSEVHAAPAMARLNCPACHVQLKITEKFAGQTTGCPQCRSTLIVARDLGSLKLSKTDSDDTQLISRKKTAAIPKPSATSPADPDSSTTPSGKESSSVQKAPSAETKNLTRKKKTGSTKVDSPKQSSRLTLTGHHDPVLDVAFSPDAQHLASAGMDHLIKIWDPISGQERSSLQGHTQAVTSVRFTTDNQSVLSAGHDRSIRLWDITTGTEIAEFVGNQHLVDTIDLSRDGQWLASSDGEQVRLWNVESRETVRLMEGHTAHVTHVAFNQAGSLLASASKDHSIRIWNPETGALMAVLEGHEDEVNCVWFSPDDQQLVSASADQTTRIWNVSGEEEFLLKSKDELIYTVCFSPDGRRVVSAGSPLVGKHGTVKIWDAHTGQLVGALKHTNVLGLAFSPDSKRLAAANADGTVKIYTEQVLTLLSDTRWLTSVPFSDDASKLASAGGYEDNTVKIWDAQ
ncbi:MAG: WD40 repeat domain-containing protein, partial [Planctomycetaceae bacterium]|nr:WD40 repeat domain-containing protein [Planctomycetaceae bacterium]